MTQRKSKNPCDRPGLLAFSLGSGVLLVGLLAILWGPLDVLGQAAKGKFPVVVRPTTSAQHSLKVDSSTTPQRTEIGCEVDQEGGTTVNGWRIVGAATTVAPTIQSLGCANGGDTSPDATIKAGSGNAGLTFKGANAQASGRTAFNALTATVNQSGTAAYDGIQLNVTETATGSGAKNLEALQVAGVDKWVVDDTGQVTTGFLGSRTDITMVYAAVTYCKGDSTNLAVTRVAANDWALARTAAGAETYNIVCTLPAPTRTTAGKGWKLTAFSLAQQITVVALTSNTFNALATTTYANNAANAVAGYGGVITITMPTVVQANPYLTAGTVGTAAFMVTANAQITMDFTVVMANTGVYRLYGVSATWTVQD